MNPADVLQLEILARSHGIHCSYLDNNKIQRRASPNALVAVLQALDIDAHNHLAVRNALKEFQSSRQSAVLDPVNVCWDQLPLVINARNVRGRFHARIIREDGQSCSLRANVDGRLKLPSLPFGYHWLEIEAARGPIRSLILSSPRHSFSPSRPRKELALFAPMYALRSRSGWGAGTFSEWRRFADFANQCGASIVATLPLLPAFLDRPFCEPSPYSPATRLFWNEFYIDAFATVEFARSTRAKTLVGSPRFKKQLQALRRNRLVDYCAEWRLRRMVLEILAAEFFAKDSPRRRAFDQFVRNRPDVEDYAAFRAVCDHRNVPWQNWPARLRDGILRAGDFDENVRRLFLFAQWIAQEQVNDLAPDGKGNGLYLDLPLGVNPHGFDVWRHPDSFALRTNVGAPPDVFFTKGQDWGFSPLHPRRIRENHYRYVIEFLRFQMRHTNLLRVDHVMGLHRLFWIPKGFPATDGVYVGYNAAELHAIFNIESHRHQTRLVGENLGTVPDEVNEAMEERRLRGMFVVQFSQRDDPDAALPEPPAHSVASINTHDTPTFAAHWQGIDIDGQVDLGLLSADAARPARARRRRLNHALARFLRRNGLLRRNPGRVVDVRDAILRWLARSRAEIVMVNVEDLWLEKCPQNTPGTCAERPNWRQKFRFTLEQILANPAIRSALRKTKR